MNNKNSRFLILGLFIGIVLTLIIVRLTDLMTEDQFVSDDDFVIDQMLTGEYATNSATESSMDATQDLELTNF